MFGVSLMLSRLHPYLAQPELLEYCKSKGIYLTAYIPTGKFTSRTAMAEADSRQVTPLSAVTLFINELAAKYNASPAQVILAWHIARGTIVVPKSQDPQRQEDDVTVGAFIQMENIRD
ncbi:NADP-dependent oxidoreductase domain-containing protein [Lanmaoa asiatica]|nr:NADP-dependent oxidoreductase domain-containing protein [Lanmaoa asiatica]